MPFFSSTYIVDSVQQCDRGPETGSICSFCSKKKVECVRNRSVKGEEVCNHPLFNVVSPNNPACM